VNINIKRRKSREISGYMYQENIKKENNEDVKLVCP